MVLIGSRTTQNEPNCDTVWCTWSQLRDGTQQVIVDDRHGVLRLFPANRRGGRGGDQELLLRFRGLQSWTPNVDGLQPEIKSVIVTHLSLFLFSGLFKSYILILLCQIGLLASNSRIKLFFFKVSWLASLSCGFMAAARRDPFKITSALLLLCGANWLTLAATQYLKEAGGM